jgi:hypothetical protein
MHKEGKAESGANNDYGRVPTLSLHSKPSGGADLRVSRGFGENTRFGGAAAPPYQGQFQDAPVSLLGLPPATLTGTLRA